MLKLSIVLLLTIGIYGKEFSLDTLKAMCFRKDSNSCNQVGKWYSEQMQNDKISLRESKIYYQVSCKFGNPVGCYNVGIFYQNGYGGIRSKDAAYSYFEVACLGGHAESCFQMGTKNSIGMNAISTREDATYYFKKSCFLGYSLGCDNFRALSELPRPKGRSF